MTTSTAENIEVREHAGRGLSAHWARWEAFALGVRAPLSYNPAWLAVMERGLGHVPFCLEAAEGDVVRGLLPLAFLRSLLFGKFLVGMPYLNYGGVLAGDPAVARLLIDRAVDLADRLDVRYLEMRHERAVDHPALASGHAAKVHMRLSLPKDPETLWAALPAKVRNQVRKGQKCGLEIAWGGKELLPEFYDVFSRNMRDLGTPVFGRGLFLETLSQFPGRAELGVVRAGRHAAAAAMLLHGLGVTEVPSASSLREMNHTCCNMLMYWSMLERSIARGQETFDFGRSTPESGTYQFKKQWGAAPHPAQWQYYVRSGSVSDMRPDSPRNRRLIRIWQRLPVGLTRWIGPRIVRGIP